MDLNKIAIKGTTQQHLPIEDIKKDLVVLKDGSCILVIKTSSVNFDLLSEREQEGMIYAYAAIINSLTFPIQILIRSALKDVSDYIEKLKYQENKPIDPLMRRQIVSYRRFVEEVVKKNNVLTKTFYVIIPFYSVELGAAATVKTSLPVPLSMLVKKDDQKLPMEKDQIIKKAYASLEPKRDHLTHLLARVGLTSKQLTTKELIQLFYQIYNQESILAGNTEALTQAGAIIKAAKPISRPKISQSEDLKPVTNNQGSIYQPKENV